MFATLGVFFARNTRFYFVYIWRDDFEVLFWSSHVTDFVIL
jgi:hypothetical protein